MLQIFLKKYVGSAASIEFEISPAPYIVPYFKKSLYTLLKNEEFSCSWLKVVEENKKNNINNNSFFI